MIKEHYYAWSHFTIQVWSMETRLTVITVTTKFTEKLTQSIKFVCSYYLTVQRKNCNEDFNEPSIPQVKHRTVLTWFSNNKVKRELLSEVRPNSHNLVI